MIHVEGWNSKYINVVWHVWSASLYTLKMANFDLKYDFTPHLENTEETEESNWKTLEKIYIMTMNLLILMSVMTYGPRLNIR